MGFSQSGIRSTHRPQELTSVRVVGPHAVHVRHWDLVGQDRSRADGVVLETDDGNVNTFSALLCPDCARGICSPVGNAVYR